MRRYISTPYGKGVYRHWVIKDQITNQIVHRFPGDDGQFTAHVWRSVFEDESGFAATARMEATGNV